MIAEGTNAVNVKRAAYPTWAGWSPFRLVRSQFVNLSIFASGRAQVIRPRE
jgi:hypothetical protein